MDIVWIASYPKSGNTWVRFLLYSALFAPPKSAADVPAKIPDIHRQLPFETPSSGPLYMKTHFELTNKHPQLNQTCKAIHIIRNPRDVMISALNYRSLTNETNKPFPTEKFIKAYLKHGCDQHWKKMGFGSWATHARSWRSTKDFPVLPLRYEDLKADPKSELIKILDFLDISKTDQEIEQAVKASSFDSMKALEIREKKMGKPNSAANHFFVGTQNATRKGIYFMNKGLSNQSLDGLMPGLDDRFNARFSGELEEFGYDPIANT